MAGRVNWVEETRRLVHLAVPTILISFGFYAPQTFIITSYVGRTLGVEPMDGYMLGTMTSNLTCLAIIQGLITASDTLSPQAYGAGNKREVGMLAIRGFFLCLVAVLPFGVSLCIFLNPILKYLHQPTNPALLATEFYRTYVYALPFYTLFIATWKFLAAQERMKPLMIVSVVILCGVSFVLDFFVKNFGYIGAAWTLVVTNVAQSLLLLAYLFIFRPFDPDTWPGLTVSALKTALSIPSIKVYMTLGVGGILAMCEWIFWEAMAILVGTFGVTALGAHSIAAQVSVFVGLVPFGMALALSVRIGATIPISAANTKRLIIWGYAGLLTVCALITVTMYVGRYQIFGYFTSNKEVLELVDAIWWKVCVYFLLVCLYFLTIYTGVSLGMQWTVAVASVVVFWLLSFPAMVVLGIVYNGGLQAVWTVLIPTQILLGSFLLYKFFRFDWDHYHDVINKREQEDARRGTTSIANEQTPLVGDA